MALELNERKELSQISIDELPEYVPLVPLQVGERRILAKIIQQRDKTVSGVVIPESVQSSKTPTAVVVDVGEGVEGYQKGEIIYVNPNGSEFIEYEDITFAVLFAGSIIAKLTDVFVPVEVEKKPKQEGDNDGNVSEEAGES